MSIFDNREEQERIRKRAEEAQKKYEALRGVKYPEEAPAEEGDISDYVLPLTAGIRGAGKAGASALLNKMREQGAPKKPQQKPLWSDLTPEERAATKGGFPAYIRSEPVRQGGSKATPVQKQLENLDNYYANQAAYKSRPMTETDATRGFKPSEGVVISDGKRVTANTKRK